MGWGRNAMPGKVESRPPRYGLRSIGLAVLALACVIASFAYLVNLPSDASDRLTNNASIVALLAYFVVAPILHIAGLVFGVIGAKRATVGKASSIVGILLNVSMFGLGILLIAIAGSGLTAFR